jgi:hypothetical protein
MVVRAARIDRHGCDAFFTGAAIEGPSMGVLRDGDVIQFLAINARWQNHIREACGTLKWAAIGNFTDAGDVIKLGVPFEVKVGITDRSRRISARGALRNLVVNVEVLGATGLLVTIAAMLGEHCCSVGITLEFSISMVVLISPLTFRVAGNLHWTDRKHFGPSTEKVDLQTDG